MFYFERFLLEYLNVLNSFIGRKYVVGENRFVRNRKMTLKDIVYYILTNKGRINYIEAIDFINKKSKHGFNSITPQAIGKQRQYLLAEIFIKISEAFIDKLYKQFKGFSSFKGYLVLACDGSIFDLPNTQSLRKNMEIGEKGLIKYANNTRARVSCLLDVNSGFILTSRIEKKKISEITLALNHLENLKNRFDLKRVITIYDRGYDSIELMATTENYGSKYLIRLKKSTFKNQINKLNSNDGIIEINLTNARLKSIRDEKLREKLRNKNERFKIRIKKVKLKTGKTKILATNLTQEKFSIIELKELYSKRWAIETGYDKLKNLIQIEEFSGNREFIIKQDFYARIFTYNFSTAIQIDSQKRITRKTRDKNQTIVYKVNFSKITGLIYLYFYNLLTQKPTKRKKTLNFIIKNSNKLITQENLNKNRKKERKPPDVNNKHPGNKKRTH